MGASEWKIREIAFLLEFGSILDDFEYFFLLKAKKERNEESP